MKGDFFFWLFPLFFITSHILLPASKHPHLPDGKWHWIGITKTIFIHPISFLNLTSLILFVNKEQHLYHHPPFTHSYHRRVMNCCRTKRAVTEENRKEKKKVCAVEIDRSSEFSAYTQPLYMYLCVCVCELNTSSPCAIHLSDWIYEDARMRTLTTWKIKKANDDRNNTWIRGC